MKFVSQYSLYKQDQGMLASIHARQETEDNYYGRGLEKLLTAVATVRASNGFAGNYCRK